MLRVRPSAVVWPVAALAALGLAACGSPRYRLVEKEKIQPAAPQAMSATAAGVEFSVEQIIVYDSPGAWKQHAYWDEYAVRLTNHREVAVVVGGVSLGDVLDRRVSPGADPWALDKEGRKHERYLQGLRAPVDPAGSARQRAAVGVRGVAAAGALALIYVPGVASASVGAAVVYGAPLVLAAAVPFIIVNKVFVDPGMKQRVLVEFSHRRLVLPVTLGPGATVAGSVFFPLTPGPERITATIPGAPDSAPVAVELPGLEGLHFSYCPDKAALLQAAAAKGPFLFRQPIPERKPAGPAAH